MALHQNHEILPIGTHCCILVQQPGVEPGMRTHWLQPLHGLTKLGSNEADPQILLHITLLQKCSFLKFTTDLPFVKRTANV